MDNNSSCIFNKNKKNQEMHQIIKRKIKLFSLKNHRYYTNHLDYFSFTNKYKNRRLLNEKSLFKTKLNITNNCTNIYDTNYSLVKSDFSSSEKIIKKAIDFRNLSNESLFKDKDKNESTFLTDNKSQKILPSLNFNSGLNDYLRNNHLKINSYKSISNFMENNRIQRRFIFINKYCKSLVEEFEKNDFYDKLKRNERKMEIIYKKYMIDFNNYLSFLEKTKDKEQIINGMLQRQKDILIGNIKNLKEKIRNTNIAKNKCIDIKNFLYKVKGDNKNDNNNNNDTKNDNNDNNNDIIITKKSEEINKYSNKNVLTNNSKLFLTPIKIKKVVNSTIIKQSRNKSPKKVQIKQEPKNIDSLHFKSKDDINIFEKKDKPINQFIFSTPEEFMNKYDEKLVKIKNFLNYYNKTINKINKLRKYNIYEQTLSIDTTYEEKLLSIIDSLKKENLVLKNKLNETKEIKTGKEFNVLTIKLKKIILKINSYINISKKINLQNMEINIEKFSSNSLGTKNENNLVLLKLLEKIIDIILIKDRLYKEDNNKYKKVKSENDNIKFEIIRKKQLNKLRKNEREKNRRILEYHRKARFYHLNKNGINLNFYKNLHNNFSVSSEEDLILEKIRNKKEEIKNLIFFN